MPGRHESTPRMHDTLPPPVSRIRSRLGSIALLGLLCVLLQQITIQYETQLLGLRVPGSLIHLHAGLLFAIAMLAHDRWVYHGVTFIAYAAWVGQRFLESGDYPMLFWSSVAWLLFWAWTLSCARLAGWPRASGEDRLYRRDLFPFVVHGLLLYPLGLALLGASLILLDSPANAMNAALQSLFAKQFGVAIVVLPLVAAWGERGQARWQRPLRRRDLLSFSMLCVGLALCLWATWRVRGSLSPEFDLASVLMDYRFALMAILLWCVLRLPTRHAMAALSLTLFCLIHPAHQHRHRLPRPAAHRAGSERAAGDDDLPVGDQPGPPGTVGAAVRGNPARHRHRPAQPQGAARADRAAPGPARGTGLPAAGPERFAGDRVRPGDAGLGDARGGRAAGRPGAAVLRRRRPVRPAAAPGRR
ncbi:hypothetical protein [Pseudoxanthomonas mexicana]|uniref:hypothetical protein n=1 Tax=Pseudoxanthomonas mexicana TaxID=128785 RepID=UPI00398A6BA2